MLSAAERGTSDRCHRHVMRGAAGETRGEVRAVCYGFAHGPKMVSLRWLAWREFSRVE